MNFKDYIMPFTFALVSTLALQYYFLTDKNVRHGENSFIAPQERKEYKPLSTEIDFFDVQEPEQTVVTEIETQWAILHFSTYGASLESLDVKREFDGKTTAIRTVFPAAQEEREKRCFLVGLHDKTPFYYSLVLHDENEDSHRLVYFANNDECSIRKTFTVNKNSSKIDLLLDVMPQSGMNITITPRVLYPAPLMPDMRSEDVISSIVIDQSDVFAKKRADQLEAGRGWFKPELFGSDSRYFIHALIADSNDFVQRAYYKLEDKDRLTSIIEGPSVQAQSSWQLSFYCGAKDLTSINMVDSRLEKTLDYSGWFSYIAKLMLYLLKWFYKYLHNYGLAIVALTLLFKILLFPLALRNDEKKMREKQAEYQHRLAIIKNRFKDNPEKLAVEQAELLKTHGMPSLGCLIPLLLQLPIFFSLSRVLASSFELYKAPMLWISDLSSRDPYYILPFIVMLVMLMPDGKMDPQQRTTKIAMAFAFGALTSTFSAGLTLYIATDRILGVVQSKLMKYFKLV